MMTKIKRAQVDLKTYKRSEPVMAESKAADSHGGKSVATVGTLETEKALDQEVDAALRANLLRGGSSL